MMRNHRRQVDDELRHHFESLVEMLVAEGKSAGEARLEASLRFGSRERYRSACLEIHQPHETQGSIRLMLSSIRQDIGYAIRTLLRAPGFTAVVIFTLALGIGANTAIFSVIDAVLMRPLGFTEPDQLVVVLETNAVNGVEASPASIATFRDWEEQSRSFEAMAAWQWSSVTLEEQDDATELLAVIATPNYFSTLGVDALLGRLFAA